MEEGCCQGIFRKCQQLPFDVIPVACPLPELLLGDPALYGKQTQCLRCEALQGALQLECSANGLWNDCMELSVSELLP